VDNGTQYCKTFATMTLLYWNPYSPVPVWIMKFLWNSKDSTLAMRSLVMVVYLTMVFSAGSDRKNLVLFLRCEPNQMAMCRENNTSALDAKD
jgi:hypothetical protein